MPDSREELMGQLLDSIAPWHFWRKSFGRKEALIYLKEVWSIPSERFLKADRKADAPNKPVRLPWLINGGEPCFTKEALDVWAKAEHEQGLEPEKCFEVTRNA